MPPSANNDLVDIFDYVLERTGSAETARRFTAGLETQCAKLASLPTIMGVARPDLRSDIRLFPFRRYIIFFRYVDDALEVVNILEGHRDMRAYFSKSDKH